MAEKKYVIDNAELMAEWNWEKNTEFDLNQLTLGSHKKVWWKCSKGHEWQATIAHKNNGRKCPYCAGKKSCLVIMTYKLSIQLYQWNGIMKRILT